METGKGFWGPIIWFNIHFLAYYQQPGKLESYKKFIEILTLVLPCDMCRNHLKEKLGKLGLENISTKDEAFLFSYILHDIANQDINDYNEKNSIEATKKQSPTFEAIRDFYSGIYDLKDIWLINFFQMISIVFMTQKNIQNIRDFLKISLDLLPDENIKSIISKFQKDMDISPYLRNQKDQFFYSYILADQVTDMKENFQQYRTKFTNALGHVCDQCEI